jgi:hypothetical protein
MCCIEGRRRRACRASRVPIAWVRVHGSHSHHEGALIPPLHCNQLLYNSQKGLYRYRKNLEAVAQAARQRKEHQSRMWRALFGTGSLLD